MQRQSDEGKAHMEQAISRMWSMLGVAPCEGAQPVRLGKLWRIWWAIVSEGYGVSDDAPQQGDGQEAA